MRQRSFWLVVVTVLALAGVVRAQQESGRAELRVLFVGNCYTYFYNLAEMVGENSAAAGSGPRILPTLAVRGGQTLEWHLENGPAMAALASGRWDYVVLQEQSLLGGVAVNGKQEVADPAAFHASVREWTRRIRNVGARPVLFMTWARRSALAEQAKLSEAYNAIGRELGVDVAPVGEAWSAVRTRWLSLDLHIFDESHPTPAGSYLAACVIYATLTGRDPSGAPSVILGHPISRGEGVVDPSEKVPLADLGATTAGWLQEMAWRTVEHHRRP
jgi:hypothetical protein